MSDCDSFVTDRECRYCYGNGHERGLIANGPCHNCHGLGQQPTHLGDEVIAFLKRLGCELKVPR